MNIIFAQIPKGIIKLCVVYNTFWAKYQLYIDGTLYGDFDKQEEAVDRMFSSINPEQIIKPHIIIVGCELAPSSMQLPRIFNEDFTDDNFEMLYSFHLLKHRKTGIIIQNIGDQDMDNNLIIEHE